MKLFTNKKAFYVLWAGQSLSLLGSSLTRFALMIWVFQQEGSITSLVLLGFFSNLTYILASPFAGVLTDRINRKWVMLFADACSGLVTFALLLLSHHSELRFWHLYLAQGLAGAFEAFQTPAFFSSVSLLVPKELYTRSNAMIGVSKSAVQVMAPVFSSAILAFGGLEQVMQIDLFTLVLGVTAVLLVRLAKPAQSDIGAAAQGSFWHEFRFGFGYIFSQPGLRAILLIFVGINLFAGMTYMSILSPMILTRTQGNEVVLGAVQSIMGAGGILGGLVLTLWKTPRRKAALYTWSTMISFGVCDLLTASSRSMWGWSAAGFISEFSIPFIISPYYSIWQERVPPDVQGRVFSTRDMIQIGPSPIGYLMGGLLADHVFEPLFAQPTLLSPLVGWGPGAGIAAMFMLTALLGALTGLVGVLHPAVHQLDRVEQAETEKKIDIHCVQEVVSN